MNEAIAYFAFASLIAWVTVGLMRRAGWRP